MEKTNDNKQNVKQKTLFLKLFFKVTLKSILFWGGFFFFRVGEILQHEK